MKLKKILYSLNQTTPIIYQKNFNVYDNLFFEL